MGCNNSRPNNPVAVQAGDESRPILSSSHRLQQQHEQNYQQHKQNYQQLPQQQQQHQQLPPQQQQRNQVQQQERQVSAANDSQRILRMEDIFDEKCSLNVAHSEMSNRTNQSSVITISVITPDDASTSSTGALGPSESEIAPARNTKNGKTLLPSNQQSNSDRSLTPSRQNEDKSLHSIERQPPTPALSKGQGVIDPHWEYLFTTLSPHLLDPEDLPSTLDATLSKMINCLSPAELSFIRRRVRDSIRAIGSSDGNVDGSASTSSIVGFVSSAVPGSDGRRSSLSKKMGRLVGYSSNSEKASSGNIDGSNHLGSHPALDESVSGNKFNKNVFQRERLLDIATMRKVFEGGERSLRALRASVKAEQSDPGGAGNVSSPSTYVDLNRKTNTGLKVTVHDSENPSKSIEQLDRESLEKIDVYKSAFLLLLYMSEVRWDYITEVAKLSAKEAGLTMDVNKLALQEEEGTVDEKKDRSSPNEKLKNGNSAPRPASIPLPPRAPSFTPPSDFYNLPDLRTNEPVGIQFSLLCFLIATALRGTRRQKLSLLFHLLLPPEELHAILVSHPAGGLPTWLLELDGDTVLSYDSLSFYYNYEGVLLPSVEDSWNSDHTSHDRKRLCIDAKSAVEVLASVLAESLGLAKDESQGRAYGIQLLRGLAGIVPKGEGYHTDQSMQEANVPFSAKCQEVDEILQQVSQGHGGSHVCPSEANQVRKFIDLATALVDSTFLSNDFVRLTWSMSEFVEWANSAINDMVLDNITHSLFGTGILPCAKMECQLVAQRWIDWNLQHLEDNPTAEALIERCDGRPATSSRGRVRKMFTSQNEPDQPSDEANQGMNGLNHVWGGIGGPDGKGGLGFGVLYCIDRQWWDTWVAFTGWRFDKSDKHNSPRSIVRPGQLSSESLINRSHDINCVSGSRGSYETMKQKVVRGKDYVLVPPGVWNVLYKIYGGGPPLPRMVLPENDVNEAHLNGEVDLGAVSIEKESVEVVSPESQMESGGTLQQYPKEIPASVQVVTHPWILHCQICDPQQPYRRGDAGPMSIRIMAMPNQPLWRLFAEIIIRLPIIHSKARVSSGEGRARIWRFEVVSGKVPSTTSRYGPWALLCKNRYAEIPVSAPCYEKYEERWEKYTDKHSVESVGLSDGHRLMLEYAIVTKDGSFTWPREAAAKATTARRIKDEDAIFRLLLRGLDTNRDPLKTSIMRKTVDAMDSSGRWYQAVIVNVDQTTKSFNPEKTDSDGSNEVSSKDAKLDGALFRENTHVRVHFNDHTETHQEWIDVKSDRLAVRGRMTGSSMRNIDTEQDGEEEKSSNETKSRISAGINKKKDTNDTTSDPGSNAVCLFPSYGACGLINLGNTCYANSGWQCMSYLPLLRSYLLSGQFKINGDINRDNPLGTGGKILEEFSELLHFMWSGKYGARAPQKFRSFLAKCRSQYSGADQQDAQELLNDMFDMLHEDGNRVRKKPYVEALEDKFIEKTDLSRVGQEAWRRFLRRNRSAVSDLSMGQVYNQVTCPVCSHSSKNFDPFNMLSLPFPTVAEVIFQCTVVRRASALNCPNILFFVGKNHHQGNRPKSPTSHASPPSKDLIFEKYLIPMSRLADIGDLKMKLQNLSGISAKELRLCKTEEIESNATDTRNAFNKMYTKVTALPDKEGPCVKLLQQESLDDVSSPMIAKIIAFESTLVLRPIELPPPNDRHSVASKTEIADEASTTADELSTDSSSHAAAAVFQSKKEEKIVQEYLKVYGDEKECVVFDTNPTPLAKVISRSLWPKTTGDFTLGLRVDAIDHRSNWYPGSVIEIVVDGPQKSDDDGGDAGKATTKVKIHFDNFSAKWDEIYSIDHFNEGRVCPLYSHATPRSKPTEFIVHHRGLDRKSKKCYLFGQSFYIQCHNEWSTARAGAHILAQASRFLEISHFKNSQNGQKLDPVDQKIAEKDRHEARRVIYQVIEALVKSDKQYIEAALNEGKSARNNEGRKPFDVSLMSQVLSEKLREVLPQLPFDVRVTTANAPLGTNNEESPFPFSLVRTIGNYMNARHALVLAWREKPANPHGPKSSNKKHPDGPGHFLYSSPFLATHKQSQALLNTNQKDTSKRNALKRHPSSSHGGLHIGVCLTEFCKEQQLEATGCWRCPVCKVEREGKQSMTLWNLPDLLTFHLKRFNASSRWREKISTKVDFPITGLNMREWCDKDSPLCQELNDEMFIYDLVGVVNHYGGMTGGHYVATCKATACSPDGEEEVAYNFNGSGISEHGATEEEATPSSGWRTLGPGLGRSKEKENSSNAAAKAVTESAEPLWLQFDDDLVEPLPPRNVVSETAYVLFYRRRRMHPANIAKYSYLG